MNIPEIEELKLLVEQEYGRSLSTTTDFEEFSLHLNRKIGKAVSAATLKRIWGYVNDSHKTRKSTLDVFAMYIGHANFDKFVEWLKSSDHYNSSFFNVTQISSDTLQTGDMLNIGWSPDRLLKIRYVGNCTYEIIEARNSKLQKGDRFVTGCFIKGQPLLLPYIERNGEHTMPFVAGRNSGLSVVEKID